MRFVLIIYLIALVLNGSVTKSDTKGRCGFISNAASDTVTRVLYHSPVYGKLEIGDKVISSNLETGTKDCIGASGENVHLVIERNGAKMEFDVVRVPFEEVHD